MQIACEITEQEAHLPATVTQSQPSSKMFGCDGHCGFKGSFAEVAEHELTCKAMLEMTGVVGSLQEWRKKTGQSSGTETRQGPSRVSVTVAGRVMHADGALEHQDPENTNAEEGSREVLSSEQQQNNRSSSQEDASITNVVDADSKPTHAQPRTDQNSSCFVGHRNRSYEIALDCTSRVVVYDDEDTGTEMPYHVSPRAIIEDHFKMLEQGIHVLPHSPKAHSPRTSNAAPAHDLAPASPRPDRSAYVAPEDDMQGTDENIESPVVSPRNSIRTWRQRRMRASPTPDDSAERLQIEETTVLKVFEPFRPNSVCHPGSVTHIIEGALDAKGAVAGPSDQNACEVPANSNAIEISSEVSSPAPMTGLAAVNRGAQSLEGKTHVPLENSRERSPSRVHEHKDLLMQVLEQQKTIASLQVAC